MKTRQEVIRYVSLDYLIKRWESDHSKITNLLERFRCERDNDVQDFINNKMLEYQLKKKTFSYFIMDKKFKNIYAYVTFKLKPLSLLSFTHEQRDTLSIFGDQRQSVIQGLLIAQLAKDDMAKHILNSANLWIMINEIILNFEFNADLLFVECKPELLKYYRLLGFVETYYDSGKGMHMLCKNIK